MGRLHTLLCRNSQGQTVVELALVLPVLLLLLLGMMEMGRVFHVYLAVTYAAREGARTAALEGSNADVFAAVQQAAPSIDAQNLTVSVSPDNRVRGNSATVMVKTRVQIMTPLVAQLFPSNPVIVSAQTVMRVE